MSKLRRHPFLILVLVGLMVVGGLATKKIYWGDERPEMQRSAARVVVAEADFGEIVEKIEAIGTTTARESVVLTAKITDTVSKVNFSDGMDVDKGAILVELTNAEDSALLAGAQAKLHEAEQQYKRIRDLFDRGNVSKSRLDEQTQLLNGAKSEVAAIEARLADRLIKAPFSGILGFRNVSPGTLLTTNTSITTLDDISIIKLDFSVPEFYLSTLQPGQSIEAISTAYDNRIFSGKVVTINSRVDANTRAVAVRAEIENSDHALRPGMLMTVNLIRSRDRVLLIPEEALIPVKDRQYVYLVGPDNIVDRVPVEIGRRRPGVVEILSGLEPGQKVITEGTTKVRTGASVDVIRIDKPVQAYKEGSTFSGMKTWSGA